MLGRSPLVLVILLAYPLVVAALVGLVASYANAKPRVALVDEDRLAGLARDRRSDLPHRADDRSRRRRGDARPARPRRGRAPARIRPDRRAARRSPRLRRPTSAGWCAAHGSSSRRPRADSRSGSPQQVQALVYQLNRELSDAYVEANLRYIDLLLEGGEGKFLGQRVRRARARGRRDLLDELPPGPRLDRIREFVAHRGARARGDRRGAPRHGEPDRARGVARRGPHVGAVGAGAVVRARADDLVPRAPPRRSRARGRARRGRARTAPPRARRPRRARGVEDRAGRSRRACCWGSGSRSRSARSSSSATSRAASPGRGCRCSRSGSRSPARRSARSARCSAALAREGRTASLVAILAVLPIVFLGLVPREVAPAAAAISDAFPFAHGVRFFTAALFDLDPRRRSCASRRGSWA